MQSLKRGEDEALLARGGMRSQLRSSFEQEDLDGHRTLYIGVHVPLDGTRRRPHHRHRHHGNRYRKRIHDCRAPLLEGRESPVQVFQWVRRLPPPPISGALQSWILFVSVAVVTVVAVMGPPPGASRGDGTPM
ncbi:unnamed protein product [Arctogadus glacialis]